MMRNEFFNQATSRPPTVRKRLGKTGVNLGSVGDRRPGGIVSLSLMAVIAVLVALASAGCSGEPEVSPNLVLITLDTTRADHLGCYGDPEAHTPTLDSLATRGVRFANVVATYPVTLPSHCSILTGLNPTRHGVRDNAGYLLAESDPIVQQFLDKSGYQTGAFVSAFVLAQEFGLGRGFDHYDDALYAERIGNRTTRAALGWLQGIHRDEPFFIWVHYYDPHTPLRPPEPYRSMDLPSDYAREVAAMDGAIGLLLGEMRETGLLENTAILVVADHGEGLGDHGEREHGLFLYDETIAVPMLLVYDGGPVGRVIETQVSIIDIAPTLLDLAGLPAVEEMEGASLIPLIDGEPWTVRRAAYFETFFPELNYHYSGIQGLRTPRWKYIRAPRSELYDLTADPGETQNVFGSHPDTARIFTARLDRYMASLPEQSSAQSEMSAEALERIQSLGYLSGGEISEDPGAELPDPKDMMPILDVFTEAKEASYEKRWADAEIAYEKVLEHSPQNLIAGLNLGKVRIKLHKYDLAIEALERTQPFVPNHSTVAKYLGQAYRLAGYPEKGLEAYRIAADDEVQHWLGVLGMARCMLDSGRLLEAKSFLEGEAAHSLENNPAKPMAAEIGRYIEALGRYKATGGAEARLEIAAIAIGLELLDEASALLEQPHSSDRLEARRYLLRGTIAGIREEFELAVKEFEASRDKNPDDGHVQEQLASLYLAADRPRDALDAGNAALRLGLDDPRTHYNIACAYARMGQTSQAIDALERSIKRGYRRPRKILEDPDLVSLQSDPAFLKLAERVARQ